ncbi:hypothetical protein M427DRAFT_365954 [Gonapodya prolifera JEL478]|uniref:Helicase C-terminal domain-containing protein n=1 Tax=Gonapodya prolifera (strain JEL478) TaxID=1344416 RepID=A0A139AAB8_GONPJ|nr:hypothetical protein M427DRAFT_365954 [Gonapodya prolifera JEL478]|eukprot:KXS13648.1 hypothetical protein M427DRAFT_365954 [Gonapodya prolifera JEL478]
MLDVWWNPALEDQAIDRVHRIGHLKGVKVFRLTMANSVESRILALQRQKKALSRGVKRRGRRTNGEIVGRGARSTLRLRCRSRCFGTGTQMYRIYLFLFSHFRMTSTARDYSKETF